MKCPYCEHLDNRVIDSRLNKDATITRRRRECLACAHRFTTYERISYQPLVQKRDGRVEPFSADKVRAGIEQALVDRPVPAGTVEALVVAKESLFGPDRAVVSAREIGDTLLTGLGAVDEVAYLRFASVYKEFTGAIVAANVREGGELVVIAASSAWASRLRYESDALLEAARAAGVETTVCRVRVTQS